MQEVLLDTSETCTVVAFPPQVNARLERAARKAWPQRFTAVGDLRVRWHVTKCVANVHWASLHVWIHRILTQYCTSFFSASQYSVHGETRELEARRVFLRGVALGVATAENFPVVTVLSSSTDQAKSANSTPPGRLQNPFSERGQWASEETEEDEHFKREITPQNVQPGRCRRGAWSSAWSRTPCAAPSPTSPRSACPSYCSA